MNQLNESSVEEIFTDVSEDMVNHIDRSFLKIYVTEDPRSARLWLGDNVVVFDYKGHQIFSKAFSLNKESVVEVAQSGLSALNKLAENVNRLEDR